MKRIFIIFALLIFISSSSIYSQDSMEVFSKLTDEDIELNLLEGVKSDNLGLKVSAAYFLGERKSQKSVIPLMKILREDKSPEARIMAALSLFKIGDERGLFAVKQAIKFDDNDQVKKMCEILTQMGRK